MNASGKAIRKGHVQALAQLENTSAYKQTLDMYASSMGNGNVYLRLTNTGFTVLSLDSQKCSSMIGVGAAETRGHILRTLPPAPNNVKVAIAGYKKKQASLTRSSDEEVYALKLLHHAFQNNLELRHKGLFFLAQEWRLPSGSKLDILAVHPASRKLVIIELKSNRSSTLVNDKKKGGDAFAQAKAYAQECYEYRDELYPFFTRLGRAMALAHDGKTEFVELQLDPDHVPDIDVLWPGESLVVPQAG